MIPIHPDDVLLFTEITDAMRRVAKEYELPLRSVSGYPMPECGMADRLGDCSGNGDIRLVMRATVNGQWCQEPRNPDEVWKTAAHELAHLRHMNHGPEFMQFWDELHTAMCNQKKDHRAKILDKLVKLQKQRQSEAEIGNAGAAEAFAAKINEMLLRYELQPTDIDYAAASDNDPVIEICVKKEAYGIAKAKARIAWQESLAGNIARAHLCSILVSPGTNTIIFVGTRSHATVAEYVYGTLVPLIEKMSKKAEVDYWYATGCGRGANNQARGYRVSWIDAFISRIWERFREAREAAVREMVERQGTSKETGLMRLDGALLKVRKYIDDKFSSRRAAQYAGALSRHRGSHADAQRDGRAAADRIELGRRALTTNHSAKRMLGE